MSFRDLYIEHTVSSDLPQIFTFLNAAIAYQKTNNYPVWPLFDRALLEKDINDKLQYKIMINNDLACVFTICHSDPIVWRDKDQDKAIYLHRVIVNPKYKGNRLFGHVKQWALDYAKSNDIPFIRMDTWADNPSIMEYYKSFGFRIVEYFTTPDTEELPIQQRGNDVVLFELDVK